MTNTNSFLRRLLIGSLALMALFAVGGMALFTAQPAAAQYGTPADTSAESAEVETVEESAPLFLTESDEVSAEADAPATAPAQGQAPQRGRANSPAQAATTAATNFGRGSVADNDAVTQAVADALGLSVEELEATKEAGTRVSELAEAQGVDIDDVYTAVYNVQVVAVEAAVADGTLTAEQGDLMLARLEIKYLAKIAIDRDEVKAAAYASLGLTEAEVEAAKETDTLGELLEENGITREDVHEAREAAQAEALAQAVAEGVITQAQADEIAENSGCNGRRGNRGNGNRGGNQDNIEPEAPAGDA